MCVKLPTGTHHYINPVNRHSHSGLPGNEEADQQANAAREDSGSTSVSEHISRQRTGPGGPPNSERLRKQWESERCSKHCGYRSGPDKAGSRRQIPTRSKKSLATRHYQLKCGHAPTATYLKRFNQRDDDQCWWCGKAAQTQEHLFRHCRKWKNKQRELWRAVGRETGWKVGRCRHVQISELFLWRSAIKR